MPRQAAASMPTLAGSGTACSAGSVIAWAAVPKGRRHWPFHTQTRSPRRAGETPLPTQSTSVAVRDHPRECDLARQSRAVLDVRGIDAGRTQAHPHFAGRRLRSFDIADPQHIAGGAISFVIGSAHEHLISVLALSDLSPFDLSP